VIAELRLEPVLGQVEREREEPSEPRAEAGERREVVLEGGPQLRRSLGPAVPGNRRAPVE
jgi:hypothetical protein